MGRKMSHGYFGGHVNEVTGAERMWQKNYTIHSGFMWQKTTQYYSRFNNVYWIKTLDILGCIHIVRIEKLGAVLVICS
jgi:hypothetical protein